jgi:hypothetical protein
MAFICEYTIYTVVRLHFIRQFQLQSRPRNLYICVLAMGFGRALDCGDI